MPVRTWCKQHWIRDGAADSGTGINMDFLIEGSVLKRYIGDDTKVVVPKGVTEIDDSAFSSSSVEEVNLPMSLLRINQYAFYDTKNLQTLELPPNLRYIGRGAFSRSGIRCISLPPKIRMIAHELFSYSALEKIEIPHGVTVIGHESFRNCNNLTKVNIPNSVTLIESNAFYEAKRLSEVIFGNKGCEIGANAFGLCDELSDSDGFIVINGVLHKSPALYIDEEVIIPDAVTVIADHSLDANGECKYCRDDGSDIVRYCKKIVIPGTLKQGFSIHNSEVEEIVCYSKINIRTMDLLGCINLKKISLPKGCEISTHAFGIWKENAKALRKLEIHYCLKHRFDKYGLVQVPWGSLPL